MHYSIDTTMRTVDDLRAIFPEPVADEMNFVLFSTSGVHGSYCTIEDAEAEAVPGDRTVTVLVVHPRTVTLRCGNVTMFTVEDAAYLKALRASSWAVVQRIGAPEVDRA
jgi:hypothetical protein